MEKDFTYAHNDTSKPERSSRTIKLNKFNFSPLVQRIRKEAFKRNIPVSSDETLQFIRVSAAMAKPKKILEIGAAVGVSGVCMLESCRNATLTTIEINQEFAAEAERNFAEAGVADRAKVIVGDAAEILAELEGGFDFIFLDGPKVQYIKYLPELKRLLNCGGALLSDDVLMYGWVNGEKPAPPKRKMLVGHIREYIEAVTSDEELTTAILDIGNGIALSIKKDVNE